MTSADRTTPPTVRRPFEPPGFDEPLTILEVELTEGLGTIDAAGSRSRHRRGLVLVRLHSQPMGLALLDLRASDRAASWGRSVLDHVGPAVTEHLARDENPGEAPDAESLDLWSGTPVEHPRCTAHRSGLLEDPPSVTVVVATRERPVSLSRCLDSLAGLDYPAVDVVVVDNAPDSDGTRSVVRARDDRLALHYVVEPRRGLGAGHNRALEAATGTILAFTDDDVVVDRHWITELVAPFASDRAVAATSGLILPAELETRAQLMLEAHGRFSKGFVPRRFDLADHRAADPLFPFTAGQLGSGANMAFRADYLRAAGGFDPALGTGSKAMGGDDLAALFGVVASGRTLAYQPSAVVWHRHHRELDALEQQAYGYGIGLGAFLASVVVHRPRTILWLAPRLRPGIARARRLGSVPTSGSWVDAGGARGPWSDATGSTEWPRSLRRRQRRGMLCGPFAYAASRRALARPVAGRTAG